MLKEPVIDWNKMGGLLPAVVQDAVDGRVLMVGYMNEEALDQTREMGQVTFWSRSRNTLWTKGQTSDQSRSKSPPTATSAGNDPPSSRSAMR